MIQPMNLDEVVMRLIGPVTATGESHTDDQRLENLKTLTWLVDRLLGEISIASRASERQEYSMQRIGKYAKSFLMDVKEYDV